MTNTKINELQQQVEPLIHYPVDRYYEIARWHADLQVAWWQDFWTELTVS